jgi:hypothetical protein
MRLAIEMNMEQGGKIDLKKMTENLIRKDLEVFRIQDLIVTAVGEVDWYSRHDDEFSSMTYALQLALDKGQAELDEYLDGAVGDAIVTLAFTYKHYKDQVGFLGKLSRKANEMIWGLCDCQDEEQMRARIVGFEDSFPNPRRKNNQQNINQSKDVEVLDAKGRENQKEFQGSPRCALH